MSAVMSIGVLSAYRGRSAPFCAENTSILTNHNSVNCQLERFRAVRPDILDRTRKSCRLHICEGSHWRTMVR